MLAVRTAKRANLSCYLVTHRLRSVCIPRACMRASLFLGELWKDALIQNRNRMQCRSLDALSFRATLGVLALRAALLTSQWLPQIESTS